MKHLILFVSACILTLVAAAQSQTATTTFNKKNYSAVIYHLPFSDEAVSNGLANKMAAFGSPKKVKDFLMYRNVFIADIKNEPLTLYFNVERKSRRDKDNAVLTMIIANEFDRFFALGEDTEVFTRAQEYLNSFEAAVAAANLELQILAQEDEIKSAAKKLKNIEDDGKDYEKEKRKIEDKIADNLKDIAEQEKEVAKEKEKLDELIKQRKN